MRWLASALLFFCACATDVEVYGPDDPFWDDGYEHDEIGDEDEVGALSAPTQTVWSAATTGACSTSVVRGLSEQLIEEVECMRPGTMARIDALPGVSLGGSAFPYLQRTAAEALGRAGASQSITLSSALRTTVQQFVLYTWYRNGRCTQVVSLAAPPGRSNHEGGIAIDVPEYGGARTTLGNQGFRWLGGSDPVHFDYTGASADLRHLSVLAFQRLWNRNQPGDPIGEDGAWGPQTEARVRAAPSAGFARGSSCGQGVGGGFALEVGWERQPDGSYAVHADGDPSVVRVEYRVDGYLIGEGAGAGLATTYAFNVATTARRLEARGLDAGGAAVGRGVGLIDTVPGTAVFIRQVGRRLYEIGLERASADVAAIEVRADGFLITDGVSGATRSIRGAVRSMFNEVGERSFEITTYDAGGAVRGTLRRTFVLE